MLIFENSGVVGKINSATRISLTVILLSCFFVFQYPTSGSSAENCVVSSAGLTSRQGGSQGSVTCKKPGPKDFGGGGSSGAPSPCTWSVAKRQDPVPAGAKPGGKWYVRYCKVPGYETYAEFEKLILSWGGTMNMGRAQQIARAGITREYAAAAPPARPSARDVMLQRVASLPYPTPVVRLNPGITRENFQVVHTSVFVWLTDAQGGYSQTRFARASQSVTLAGYRLAWTIVPTLKIEPGSGYALAKDPMETAWPTQPRSEPVTCQGSARPWYAGISQDYDASYCQLVYRKSGHFQLAASVTWTIEWSADGIPNPH